jgi:RND family efflux transporter MFP subunit
MIGLVSGLSVAYGGASESSTAGAGDGTTQVIPVQYGDLTSTIYASGSLVYSTSEQLAFDSAGTVAEVNVAKDDTVKKGDVLARLDSESIQSVEQAVAKARINLRDAQQALQDAQNPYSELDIASAQNAVEQAQVQLTDAQTRGPIQVANAQYALDKAYQRYTTSLAGYMGGTVTFDEYQQAMRDWETAKLDLASAKVNADKSVIDAESKLATVQQTLADVLAGPDPLEVALRQSELDSAQAALDDALQQLESAKEGYPVVAPFDGVVASVNVSPGDEVNANTVALELIDPSAFEMSAIVDEIDVAQLRLGQEATVALDAISDVELHGNVTSISAFAQSQSGVVSYPISISLTVPDGVQLLAGMSATATVEIKLASHALLVPSAAVTEMGGRSVVMVMVDGQPQPRMVTVGATDGVETEVVTGINEGDEVIVQTATTGTSSGTSSGSSSSGREFPGGGIFDGGGFTIRGGQGGGF